MVDIFTKEKKSDYAKIIDCYAKIGCKALRFWEHAIESNFEICVKMN